MKFFNNFIYIVIYIIYIDKIKCVDLTLAEKVGTTSNWNYRNLDTIGQFYYDNNLDYFISQNSIVSTGDIMCVLLNQEYVPNIECRHHEGYIIETPRLPEGYYVKINKLSSFIVATSSTGDIFSWVLTQSEFFVTNLVRIGKIPKGAIDVKYVHYRYFEYGCWVDKDGFIDCIWDQNTIGLTSFELHLYNSSSMPLYQGHYAKVMFYPFCGLTTKGDLICANPSYSIPNENIVEMITLSDSVQTNISYFVSSGGNVYSSIPGRANVDNIQGQVVRLSASPKNASEDKVCALLKTGSVACWDTLSDKAVIEPFYETYVGQIVDIVVSIDFNTMNCATLKDGSMVCAELDLGLPFQKKVPLFYHQNGEKAYSWWSDGTVSIEFQENNDNIGIENITVVNGLDIKKIEERNDVGFILTNDGALESFVKDSIELPISLTGIIDASFGQGVSDHDTARYGGVLCVISGGDATELRCYGYTKQVGIEASQWNTFSADSGIFVSVHCIRLICCGITDEYNSQCYDGKMLSWDRVSTDFNSEVKVLYVDDRSSETPYYSFGLVQYALLVDGSIAVRDGNGSKLHPFNENHQGTFSDLKIRIDPSGWLLLYAISPTRTFLGMEWVMSETQRLYTVWEYDVQGIPLNRIHVANQRNGLPQTSVIAVLEENIVSIEADYYNYPLLEEIINPGTLSGQIATIAWTVFASDNYQGGTSLSVAGKKIGSSSILITLDDGNGLEAPFCTHRSLCRSSEDALRSLGGTFAESIIINGIDDKVRRNWGPVTIQSKSVLFISDSIEKVPFSISKVAFKESFVVFHRTWIDGEAVFENSRVELYGADSKKINLIAHNSSILIESTSFTESTNLRMNGCKVVSSDVDFTSCESGDVVFNVKNSELDVLNSQFINNRKLFLFESSLVNIKFIIAQGNVGPNGGAMDIQNSEVNISDAIFFTNSAQNGGAVSLVSSGFTCIGCIFTGNIANENGGDIYSFGKPGLEENLYGDCLESDFTHHEFVKQTVDGFTLLGYSLFPSRIRLVDVKMIQGNAVKGGSLYVQGTCMSLNNILINDTYSSSHGGALYVDSSKLELVESTISESIAGGNGIIWIDSRLYTFENNTFKNNAVKRSGGSIYYKIDFEVDSAALKHKLMDTSSYTGGSAVHYGDNVATTPVNITISETVKGMLQRVTSGEPLGKFEVLCVDLVGNTITNTSDYGPLKIDASVFSISGDAITIGVRNAIANPEQDGTAIFKDLTLIIPVGVYKIRFEAKFGDFIVKSKAFDLRVLPCPGGKEMISDIGCQECSTGSYSNTSGCIPCPEGTYSNEKAQTECKKCSLHTYTTSQTGNTVCLECSRGSICDSVNQYECSDVENAKCANGNWTNTPGYWMYNPNTQNGSTLSKGDKASVYVVPCSHGGVCGENRCLGDGRKDFAENALCAECVEDQYEFGGDCVHCTKPNVGFIMVILVVTIVFTLAIRPISEPSGKNASAKPQILLYFAQLSVLMAGTLSRYIPYVSVVTLNYDSQPVCIAPLSPIEKIYGQLLSPLWVALVLFVIMLMHFCVRKKNGSTKQDRSVDLDKLPESGDESDEENASPNSTSKMSLRNIYTRQYIFLTLFCYTLITKIVLNALNCVTIEHEGKIILSRVYEWPQVSCLSSEYGLLQVISIIILIVYVIPVPLVIFGFLGYKVKSGNTKKMDKAFLEKYGGLFTHYRSGYIYWEAIQLLHRLLLVVLSVVFLEHAETRYFSYFMINIIFLILQIVCVPFKKKSDNMFQNVSLILLVIVCGFLSNFAQIESTATIQGFFVTFVMIPVFIMFILTLLGRFNPNGGKVTKWLSK